MTTRIPLLAAVAAASIVFVPATVHAQDDTTPTTVVVETSSVERQVPVNTTETRELEPLEGDDDDSNAGLWGLLGLLGLAGLAGLVALRRHDHDNDPPRTPDAR